MGYGDKMIYRTAHGNRAERLSWTMGEFCTLCDALIHLVTLGRYSGNISWNYRFNGVFFFWKASDYEELNQYRGVDVIT